MKIEDIIYETTRCVSNTTDKLSIITIFYFCKQLGDMTLSELLYTNNHKDFINELSQKYNVDLSINFKNQNIEEAFFKTLEAIKKKWDDNGYFKALHEKDEYAIVIHEITSTDIDEQLAIKSLRQLRLNL